MTHMKQLFSICLLAVVVVFTGGWFNRERAATVTAKKIPLRDDFYGKTGTDDACLELHRDGTFAMRPKFGEYLTGKYQFEDTTMILNLSSGHRQTMSVEGWDFKDVKGSRWTRMRPEGAAREKDLVQVRITVHDEDTGRPVQDFSFDYCFETPAGFGFVRQARRQEIRGGNGSFTVRVPMVCELTVCVDSPDFINGFGNWGSFTIEPGAKFGSFDIKLRRGAAVCGIVTEKATDRRVSGARVAAIVSLGDTTEPDLGRAVLSDKDGRFVLRGVDPELGMDLFHPEFEESTGPLSMDKATRTGVMEFAMRLAIGKGAILRGMVLDSLRRPLAGVAVDDGVSKSGVSDPSGLFSLSSPGRQGGTYRLRFKKDGYVDRTVEVADGGAAIEVLLQTKPELRGIVLDPEGNRVKRFEVVTGPGRFPGCSECRQTEVVTTNGSFRFDFRAAGTNWVALRADGFTPWETWVDTSRFMSSIVVRLARGATVNGRVAGRAVPSNMEVVLVPKATRGVDGVRLSPAREVFFSRKTSVMREGVFRIRNVDPGDFILSLSYRGMVPMAYDVTVDSEDVFMGDLGIKGTGTIHGRVFKPETTDGGQAWAFAEGEIRMISDPVGDVLRPFKAGEDGVFQVRDIPVGTAVVTFSCEDLNGVMGESVRLASVVENAETEVRFNDPSWGRHIPVQFTIGDGSAVQYLSALGGMAVAGPTPSVDSLAACSLPTLSVRLVPEPGRAVQLPEPVTGMPVAGSFDFLVGGVLPGRYMAEISVAAGKDRQNVICARELAVGDGDDVFGSDVIDVTLGAGSITGRLVPAGEATGATVAVVRSEGGKPQYVACDMKGSFCCSFLQPGTYSLFVTSNGGGFFRMENLSVSNNVCNVGECKLEQGTIVRGTLLTKVLKRAYDHSIVATDNHGITVTSPSLVAGLNGDRFVFNNLWAGQWTISMVGDGELLKSADIAVNGTGTVEANLK